MRKMRRLLFILLILLLVSPCSAQTSRALLVGIQDYPKNSGWSQIHAHNDLQIVSATMRAAGVRDLRILRDSQATHAAVVSSMKRLSKEVKEGDRVLVFFSCHGQWITDTNADEKAINPRDRYDESLIPYDAQISYNWKGRGYKGQNHLVDDELNLLLDGIRQALGSKGQLLVLYDACQSGDLDRSETKEETALRRGVKTPFEIPSGGTRAKNSPVPVSWISISACRDIQNNYECVVDGTAYGRLAYSFCQVFKPGITPKDLVDGIQSIYDSLPTSSDEPVQELSKFIPEGKEMVALFK